VKKKAFLIKNRYKNLCKKMNQSIEQVLSQATSQDVALMKEAEKTLQQYEKEPNFYSTLINVFLNPDLNPAAR
jgi:hypothetical protein